MKFGYFDDCNKEYVITNPKTPYPWINYLGSENMFGLISNTSGGYCFYKDALLRRILRYDYNNAPVDNKGRYFYINNDGDVWTPGWMPVKAELSEYECRHGMGYTKITGARGGIKLSQLSFIPVGSDCEIHKITVENTSDKHMKFSLFSYVEFCLWEALGDMTNFQHVLNLGEVEVEDSIIYHKTEYRERRAHYAFYSVNAPIAGFDTDRESFLGLYNGTDAPQVVINCESNNSIASGWSPIASHHIKLDMEPGQVREYIFILGFVENAKEDKWESPGIINKTKAKELSAQFDNPAKVEKAFAELGHYWENLLSVYKIQSSDEKLNRMVNIWNQYQCMVTFNMSRSASYFESGIGRGMGFRDSNQDVLGFVHLIPERARERILDLAATQFEDGSAYHQYQPLTKRGNAETSRMFNDDPLWLVYSTVAYIKETGDFGILDEQVPWENDETRKASLYDHLKASFHYFDNNRGPHGLPLIGAADWNDGLNLNCFSTEPGENLMAVINTDCRTAESVFIAGMYVYAGKELVDLCNRIGKSADAEIIKKMTEDMEQVVIKHGYDGEWYLRAYDAFGEKVGSRECEEGKIFIEPQGMCSMAGIGLEQGLVEKALNSVQEMLETEHGIILNTPAYSRYYENLGELTVYIGGYKENAGIFCHTNPWIAIAETVIGRGDRAFEVYKKIAPAYREEISDLHRTEPYVYAQVIAGRDAPDHGQAKNSWLTGTASYNFVAISQAILGIKPDYDGLKIDPCIPKDMKNYKVTRVFRNSTYNIEVINTDGVCKGNLKITVDGKAHNSNILPAFSDGEAHEVLVEITT